VVAVGVGWPTLNLHRALNPLPDLNLPLSLAVLWKLVVAGLPSVVLTPQSKLDGTLDSGRGTGEAANPSRGRTFRDIITTPGRPAR